MNFDKAGESLAAGGGGRAGEMASRRAWAGVRAATLGEHGRRGSGGTAGSHRISSEVMHRGKHPVAAGASGHAR